MFVDDVLRKHPEQEIVDVLQRMHVGKNVFDFLQSPVLWMRIGKSLDDFDVFGGKDVVSDEGLVLRGFADVVRFLSVLDAFRIAVFRF